MVDMAHDRDHGRARNRIGRSGGFLDRLDQLILDRRLFQRLRGMPHLFDDEGCRVLIEDLVDRDHHAHLHEGLDDLVGLHGHALRKLADRDRRADLDVSHHGSRRLLEPVLRVDVHGRRSTALFLLLAPPGHPIRDVQRVVGVGGLLHHSFFLGFLPCAFGLGTLCRFLLRNRRLAPFVFGTLTRGFVRCRGAALLILYALALLGFALLGREPLALGGFAALAFLLL